MNDHAIKVNEGVVGKYSKKVADMISYFTITIDFLSQIRLMKLLYLSEFYFMDYYNRRFSEALFYKWHYGPWSPDVDFTATVIDGKQIKIEESTTKKGHACTFIKPNVEKMEFGLSEKQINILEQVVKDWKYIQTNSLVAFTKNSDLFKKTKKMNLINMEEYMQNKPSLDIDKIKIGENFSLQVLGYNTDWLKEDDGYSVSVTKLDGCFTQGDTIEQTMGNIRDAIVSYLGAIAELENDVAR